MSFWKTYTSPLGYESNGNSVDSYGVDHSGFTTRDELQYQNARINRENELMTQMNNQGITTYPQYRTNFWGSSADNNYGFGTSNIRNNIENRQQTTPQQNPLQQVVGAIGDMVGNYVDMKMDNTIKGDDYFHCKANYEAAQRGVIGENIAEKLGNTKEEFDFWDNQFRKGLSPLEAYQDKIHDRTINQIGRQKAKSGVYKNSREACYPYRVEGINEKY